MMDYSGIKAHLPSTAGAVVIFAVSGALAAGWINQEQATIIISLVIGAAGLLYKK